MKLFKKLILISVSLVMLGASAASVGQNAEIKSATQLAAEADPNCLGQVNITCFRLGNPGWGNENRFAGLWIHGSDYYAESGAVPKQFNGAFEAIGTTAAENFAKIKVNGVVQSQTYLDLYANFWTYYPVFAFCFIGSGAAAVAGNGVFEISKDFRIPSYATMCDTTGGTHTYYTLDRNYKFVRPSEYVDVESGWTKEFDFAAEKISDCTVLAKTAHTQKDGENRMVIIFAFSGTDLDRVSEPNKPLGGAHKDDFANNTYINGVLLSSLNPTAGLISKWTPVELGKQYIGYTFDMANEKISTGVDVMIKKGTKIPSIDEKGWYEVDHAYGLHFLKYGEFINLDNLNSFMADKLHMEDYTSELGWCKDSEHHYYTDAKTAYSNLTELERAFFSGKWITNHFDAANDRLAAWAAANGEVFNGSGFVAPASHNIFEAESSNGSIAILIIVVAVASLSLGAIVCLKKRKENY